MPIASSANDASSRLDGGSLGGAFLLGGVLGLLLGLAAALVRETLDKTVKTQDDVKATLERLLSGSENHLAAFEKAVDGQVGTGTQAGQQAGRGGKGMAGGGQHAQQGPMNGTGTGTQQGQQAGRRAGTQAQQGPMDGTGPMAGTEDCPAVS